MKTHCIQLQIFQTRRKKFIKNRINSLTEQKQDTFNKRIVIMFNQFFPYSLYLEPNKSIIFH
jgi:hypothetical protein